jgi:D-tyrosyl-tRNA(Tyr) deacylase
MNKSLLEIGGDLLVISQFTLHALTKKGNRPSYIKAAKSDFAIKIYNQFLEHIEIILNKKPFAGIFGADMLVKIENDGPVTIFLDSKNKSF